MAANDPGLEALNAPAEDPVKGAVDVPSDDTPVAPDQFDERYETTRKEVWAYYSYYVGDNGLHLFNFGPTAFQNLMYQAAGDSEILHFFGKDRTINSIVLLSNGVRYFRNAA